MNSMYSYSASSWTQRWGRILCCTYPAALRVTMVFTAMAEGSAALTLIDLRAPSPKLAIFLLQALRCSQKQPHLCLPLVITFPLPWSRTTATYSLKSSSGSVLRLREAQVVVITGLRCCCWSLTTSCPFPTGMEAITVLQVRAISHHFRILSRVLVRVQSGAQGDAKCFGRRDLTQITGKGTAVFGTAKKKRGC